MKLLLATPIASEMVTVHYMNSVIALQAHVAARGFTLNRHLISHSLISRSRNAFASVVLNDPSYSHLLFIDSDIGFRPQAVLRMLDFDMPLVGCIYPSRRMDYSRYHAVTRQVEDPALAQSVALNYVGDGWEVREEQDGRSGVAMKDGFIRVGRIAGGLTLVRREVLERIAERYPELLAEPDADYASTGVKGKVLQCFEHMPGPDGLYRSEDISFAYRWTDGCGGEIWACIDEVVTHWGSMSYTGRYLDRLRFLQSQG